MSDDETTPEVEAEAAAPAVPEVMDVETALKVVLKNALVHDALARGLHECAKALDKQEAKLCVLSANCNEPAYTKLVEALCAEHGIQLMKMSDGKQLGEWAGLAKLDKEGAARKVVGCSCVVVKSWGEDSQALNVLQEYFKTQQ